MTLKKGIVWSQKKMRPEGLKRPSGKYNPIMQKLMGNKGNDQTQGLSPTALALNLRKEQAEFWGLIKSVSKDGVYKNELRKLFGDIRSGKIKTRTISKKEIMKVAKDIFPDSKRRYIFSGPAATEKTESKYTQVDSSAKNPASENTRAGRQSSFIRSRPGKVSVQTTNSPAKGVASLTPANMATIMNRIRENGEESSENNGNDQSSGGFSKALDAMRKNKRG